MELALVGRGKKRNEDTGAAHKSKKGKVGEEVIAMEF